jgi:hypothetical protein
LRAEEPRYRQGEIDYETEAERKCQRGAGDYAQRVSKRFQGPCTSANIAVGMTKKTAP